MRRRYSIGHFRLNIIGNKSLRRISGRMDSGKLHFSDILMTISSMLILSVSDIAHRYLKGDSMLLAIFVIATILLFLLSVVLKFRRKAPRTCWSRATAGLVMMSALCTALPYILCWAEVFTLREAHIVALATSPLWLCAAASFARLRYIRRRSQEIVMRLRMERKRRKAQYI